jgi:hypothetical protein
MPVMTGSAPSSTVNPTDGTQANAMQLVPFVRATAEHYEPFLTNVTVLATTGSQIIPPADVPAYGFLRGIWLQLTAVGGSGGAVTFNEDAPFSALQTVELSDVNGAPLVGPVGGVDVYWMHKYGGYRPAAVDARQNPVGYSMTLATGAFSFIIRIPVEAVARDGLAALANANASSTYKLKLTLASAAAAGGLYITNTESTQNTVTTLAWLDAYAQPDAADEQGNPQETVPPGNGTTQYWTKQPYNALNGAQTVRLSRVGNYIRNLIIIARDAANGTRQTADGNFPDPAQLYVDTKLLYNLGKNLWKTELFNWYDLTANTDASPQIVTAQRTLDKGVFVFPFTREFDGVPGFENRDMWLSTVQATRLDFVGLFGGSTNLNVLTNDVSPAGDIFV